jgi:hypothetical protein
MDDSLKEKQGWDKEEKEEQYCTNCKRQLSPYVTHCPVCGAEAETTSTKKKESSPLSIGHNLTYISGLIGFLGGIANLALAATVSMNLASFDMPQDLSQYSNNLVIIFFLAALLCLAAAGLGWGTAMNPLKKRNVKSMASMAFIFFAGSINVIEGTIIQDQTGLSTLLTWLIGFPLIALSLVSLVLTAIG